MDRRRRKERDEHVTRMDSEKFVNMSISGDNTGIPVGKETGET